MECNPYDPSVDNLSNGLIHIYEADVNFVKKQLSELTLKQNLLITQIHDENVSLAEVQYSQDIHKMFNKMKLYQAKLLNIKKDVRQIHERSTKLKKRAIRLQQFKEKELEKKQNEAENIKREESLIGQPGASGSNH